MANRTDLPLRLLRVQNSPISARCRNSLSLITGDLNGKEGHPHWAHSSPCPQEAHRLLAEPDAHTDPSKTIPHCERTKCQWASEPNAVLPVYTSGEVCLESHLLTLMGPGDNVFLTCTSSNTGEDVPLTKVRMSRVGSESRLFCFQSPCVFHVGKHLKYHIFKMAFPNSL